MSSLVWVGRAPFTAGFWLAHAFDVAAVFGLTIGGFVAFVPAWWPDIAGMVIDGDTDWDEISELITESTRCWRRNDSWRRWNRSRTGGVDKP